MIFSSSLLGLDLPPTTLSSAPISIDCKRPPAPPHHGPPAFTPEPHAIDADLISRLSGCQAQPLLNRHIITAPEQAVYWIGDKAKGKQALGREIVVVPDSKEGEVDDGSGAWEDSVFISSSPAVVGVTSSLSCQAHFPILLSQHLFSSPSTFRRTHRTGLSLDSSPLFRQAVGE